MNDSDFSILELKIRPAMADDVETIAAFNCRLAIETEGKNLDLATVTRGVAAGLQQGDEVQYFIAQWREQSVGTLMLTREWSDWRCGWFYWLQSVYVIESHRGCGVFRALLDHVSSTLQSRKDVIGLRLYVESENSAAKSTYARTGFHDTQYLVFEKKMDSSGPSSNS